MKTGSGQKHSLVMSHQELPHPSPHHHHHWAPHTAEASPQSCPLAQHMPPLCVWGGGGGEGEGGQVASCMLCTVTYPGGGCTPLTCTQPAADGTPPPSPPPRPGNCCNYIPADTHISATSPPPPTHTHTYSSSTVCATFSATSCHNTSNL